MWFYCTNDRSVDTEKLRKYFSFLLTTVYPKNKEIMWFKVLMDDPDPKNIKKSVVVCHTCKSISREITARKWNSFLIITAYPDPGSGSQQLRILVFALKICDFYNSIRGKFCSSSRAQSGARPGHEPSASLIFRYFGKRGFSIKDFSVIFRV